MRRLLLVMVLLLLAAGISNSSTTLLWRIGSCDGNYAELAVAGDWAHYTSTFPNDLTFTVGTNPAVGWPYIQPGPADAWAGSKSHTHSIVFNLGSVPAGGAILQLNLIDAHSFAPPTLRITIKGQAQDMELKPGAGDGSLTDPHAGRAQSLRVYLPASALVAGNNKIDITTTSGSWMIYDCIQLWKCDTTPPLVENLSVSSTFLFKNSSGGLKQILAADFSLLLGQSSIHAQITSGSAWQTQQDFTNVHCGTRRLELEIPPVTTTQTIDVTLTVSGAPYQVQGTATPQKQWKVYLLPSSHFDYGYTAPQSDCLNLHRQNTERAITWAQQYSSFGWNLECSLLAEDYLANGSRPNDLINLARQGRIGIDGLYTNPLTGLCSGEELSRLFDQYDLMRNQYGISTECAVLTDVPSAVATVPMILRGHGIKYLSHGINDVRAFRADRPLFYWQSPDGSKVLTWNAREYAASYAIHGWGDSYNFELTKQSMDSVVGGFAQRTDYPYDAILLHGAYWDNSPNGQALATIPIQWNSTYAYPRLIFSRGTEFFNYVETNFAASIPTVVGDGGIYWEDGAISSAFETGETRVAKEELQTAERLIALCPPASQTALKAKLNEAWKNVLLFGEHTWGSSQSMSDPGSPDTQQQWAVKKGFADHAKALAEELIPESMAVFTAGLGAAEDSIVVFNPSSWTRNGWVECDVPAGRAQVLVDCVLPFGYRIYPASKAKQMTSEPVAGTTLENAYYRVSFNASTGAVAGIYDKQLRRELVDNTPYGANEYLYADHGTNSFAREAGFIDTNMQVRRCTGPVFQKYILPGKQMMRITSIAPMTSSFTAEVVLYDGQKRIDFTNSMDKVATLNKEGGYFAFPFAFTNPSINLEIPDGVIRPDLDQFPGACRDWYSVQHFLTVSDSSAAVVWTALDSPFVTLQDIHRGQCYQSLSLTNGSVFAYIFNNYWHVNYKASQEGPLTFRFSMTSGGKLSSVQAKRFGESVQSPLTATWLPARGPASPAMRSFINVASANVVLQAVKPARFSSGTVVRLREVGGRTTSTLIAANGIPFTKAYLCNLAEDKLSELLSYGGVINVPCTPLGLSTVLLER